MIKCWSAKCRRIIRAMKSHGGPFGAIADAKLFARYSIDGSDFDITGAVVTFDACGSFFPMGARKMKLCMWVALY